jgi:CelD/BcsL family acetyltransferase involved in cellulose biosynthesis
MIAVQLRRVGELSDADWLLWLDLCQRTGVYESPFFRPEFVRAVAAVRSDVEIAVLVQAGQTVGFFPFQRGQLNLSKPVAGKLSDYHGPLVRQGARLDPQALLTACKLASWDFDHFVAAANPRLDGQLSASGQGKAARQAAQADPGVAGLPLEKAQRTRSKQTRGLFDLSPRCALRAFVVSFC